MDISVIIVSFNTVDLIGPCLSSIIAQESASSEIFVVDNASADGSAEHITAGFPEAHLIVNKVNRGFAAANNQVITLCRGRYILFLNPDTVLKENCLAAALSYMEIHPEIGLAGLHILNPDGTDQDSVSRRYLSQRYTSDELNDLPGDITCVLGAAMIAPRETIISVGGFDEDFFLYGEDEDLCLRIRRRNLEIGFIDAARVIHYHGQSERKSSSAEVWRKKIRAEYLFYHKHYRPDTLARIIRAETLKTCWRILTLQLFLPFSKDKGKIREKLSRYREIKKELRHQKITG